MSQADVEQITRAMLDAVNRIADAAHDPAAAQAARIAAGAALLAESVTADEAALAINERWTAGGWRLVRVQ